MAAAGGAKEPNELLGPFQLKPYKNPNQLKPKKIHEMEENQSVRMEELPSRISFPSFPLQIGWRMEWI